MTIEEPRLAAEHASRHLNRQPSIFILQSSSGLAYVRSAKALPPPAAALLRGFPSTWCPCGGWSYCGSLPRATRTRAFPAAAPLRCGRGLRDGLVELELRRF